MGAKSLASEAVNNSDTEDNVERRCEVGEEENKEGGGESRSC